MIEEVNLLMSYYYLETMNPTLCPCPSIMLDSGAYTAWQSKKAINIDKLIQETKKPIYKEAVCLDVIGEGPASLKNALYMKSKGSPAFPVFHWGEEFSLLRTYCKTFPKVGLSCRWTGQPVSQSIDWLSRCFKQEYPFPFQRNFKAAKISARPLEERTVTLAKISQNRRTSMKTILIFSGGMDSTCLLYHLLNRGHELKLLSFNYGQRHKKELYAATRIASFTQLEHEIIDLQSISHLLKGSSQTDPSVEVPEGRYDAENMKLTVVPNRNMIMLSIAIAWAISNKFTAVAYAAHAGDHTIYPDCREEFVGPLRRAAQNADWHPVMIMAPYLSVNKGAVLADGIHCGAAEAVSKSWSCYRGLELHCGKCGACSERIESFKQAGVKDTTEYTSDKGPE